MLVYDKANELARTIKESKQYLEYKELRNRVFSNPELKEMIEQFEKIRYEVQLLTVMDNKQNEEKSEKMKKLEELYQILIDNKEVKEFFDKEVAFNVMLADVNKIIAEAVKDVLN